MRSKPVVPGRMCWGFKLNPLKPLGKGIGLSAFATGREPPVLKRAIERQATVDEQHKGFRIALEYHVCRYLSPDLLLHGAIGHHQVNLIPTLLDSS